jgi:tape measure domain-containing protein
VFGAKVALAVEKNIAVFGTMVHSMEQGAAIVASIQKTKAAGLFDNQQLLDSSRLLFKGGVAAVDLAAKTDQLAKIAAGTSTELGDLARIYQQGANRGSFGQDKINQLSERGIAIYEGLQHATGKSGAALDKMISDGKIGITEMDAAMTYLTEGNGYYANSLEDIGNTTGGMLTQIKNNLMQTLGALGGVGTEAFKPVLTSILAMSEGIKSSVATIAPIVNQLFMVIKGAFGGMAAIVNTAYTNVFAATTATFGGMLSVVMEWVTKFRWFFENIVPIIQFVGLSMVSIMMTAFNDIAYFLTDKMPAYLSWFAENWKNIFTDIFNGTVAIFTNLGKNIAMAMTQIWNFITSGGTAELEFAWTPLLDGFESTVAALPDIPDRAMTELEQSLEQQTQAVATQLADSFDALNVEAQAALTVATPELPAIDPTLQAGGASTGEDGAAAGKKQRSDFSVSGMERGSEAALKAIFSAQKDKTPSQALAEHKKTNAHLATIANKPQPAVLGGVT